MRYYKLSDDVQVPGRWHLGAISTSSGAAVHLCSAVRCSTDEVTVSAPHPGRPLAFSLTSFGVPVAASALAAAIATFAPRDIQRLRFSNSDMAGYEALNILRVVDCLDESRSVFEKWTSADHRPELAGQYRSVPVLRVAVDRIPPDAHIFRVHRWHVGLVVSEVLKRAMEVEGCVGAEFSDVTWSGGTSGPQATSSVPPARRGREPA